LLIVSTVFVELLVDLGLAVGFVVDLAVVGFVAAVAE
jgi:hypothetical protein